jgi:hypothetical protein|tara:strand:+ start:82 stop:474 length:393 start_codon:yes stop_codon:yes gene_type:complete
MKLTKSKLKEIIREEIKKLSEYRQPPRNSSSILPIGSVDLKTGANKILDNVYDVWPKSYVNVFKNLNRKFVGVASAGKGTGKSSQKTGGQFHHDQTGRDFGRWQFVEEIPMKDRDKLASKYKKFMMYTYK